ncbi:MAG: autoinducer binding domain-containing protein [Rhizobium sp.]|nr:autoinducer binding domain-containing protein [Rhizobium sp.]
MLPQRQTLLSQEIGSCQSRAELLECWKQAAREFGLDHVTLAIAPTVQDKIIGPLIRETTLPLDYCREFDRQGLLRYCPTVPHISRSIMHNTWWLGPDGKSPDFECPVEMADLMRQHGLLVGILFSLNAIDGTRYVVRYDGKRAPLPQQDVNELSMLTTQAFDVFDRLRR